LSACKAAFSTDRSQC